MTIEIVRDNIETVPLNSQDYVLYILEKLPSWLEGNGRIKDGINSNHRRTWRTRTV